MSTSSPSTSPPSLPRSPTSNPETQGPKKSQPFPWTHQETVHLIRAYQEKWYSLNRRQLKANQWEEVADTVASHSGYGYKKSAIQCRHKMDKLRRRYRNEKRLFSLGAARSWPYFDLMHSLECGTFPTSARPLAPIPSVNKIHDKNNIYGGGGNDGGGGGGGGGGGVEEEKENYGYRNRSKSRSINYILRKPSIVNRFAGNDREAVKKRKREEMPVAAEQKKGQERGKGMELLLAAEIRGLAERMVGMERKKMKMVEQTERWKMEMEKKRTQMILDSQRKIVDMIAAQEFNFKMVMGEHL